MRGTEWENFDQKREHSLVGVGRLRNGGGILTQQEV